MFNTSEQNQQTSTSNKPLNRKLSLSALALGAALSLTACGGDDHHETAAVDKVDEAAAMARENAPEPEPLDIDETATAETSSETATEETTEDATEENTAEEEAADSGAEEAAASEGLSASAGKDLYESNCKMCHESGLLNAPKFGNAEEWAPRIAKGKETLYKHSAEGFNQMPAQATGSVTVDQVHAAVDYMVEQSS